MEFTQKAQDYISKARLVALEQKHALIKPIHLLYAMVAEKDEILLRILELTKANGPEFVRQMTQTLSKEPVVQGDVLVNPSQELTRLLDRAALISKSEQFVSVISLIAALY